jgi:cysteine desulfurase family protein (TIGR01976 family)
MKTVTDIRAEFPALERRDGGQPVAYFDGPGGTQVPRRVTDAMVDYLHHHNANTHWAYPTSVETDAMISGARTGVAALLGARPAEIAFGANMTTLTFHLARALGRRWSAGDEVVITDLDHHANVAPWQAIARERGITLRTVAVNAAEGTLDWTSLEAAFSPRTRLLAIGAASNALGTINDVAAATRIAHAAGALTLVDAVHFVPHAPVDFAAIGCDFLVCSAYKFYGPHVGIVCGRESLIADLDVPRLAPAPDSSPERLETGTLNHEGIAGTAAAVEFLASVAPGADLRASVVASLGELHRRGGTLVKMLWDGLTAIDGVTLYGPPPGRPRTPTVAFTVAGRPSEEVARALARSAVYVSNGDFYATTIVERLGLSGEGLIRAGCACYTTEDEVERLVAAVRALGPA